MADQGVKNFGVDAPDPDSSDDFEFPTHQVGQQEKIPHMENLKNIDRVVRKDFAFYALPVEIREGTGGLMRAVAMLNE